MSKNIKNKHNQEKEKNRKQKPRCGDETLATTTFEPSLNTAL
jgi:hypothetical protein